MKTLIVGLGNPILGDDGVGWVVANAVREHVPEDVEVDCLSLGGLSLMERLIGYDRVIIIDSIQTRNGRIGQIFVFPLETLPDLSAGHTTAAHDTSLQTAIQLGRQMGADLPADIKIVAIEAERVYEFSDALSPPLAAVVSTATAVVLDALQTTFVELSCV